MTARRSTMGRAQMPKSKSLMLFFRTVIMDAGNGRGCDHKIGQIWFGLNDFLCMICVDIGATMSPLIFLKKFHQVCPLQSILRLSTRDWPISSHFWVTSCILSSYFHGITSMFHYINMFYFIKYSLQAPALACAGFHLVCNSFSLVVEQSLGLKQSLSHLIVAYFILSPLTNITFPWHQSRYVVTSISLYSNNFSILNPTNVESISGITLLCISDHLSPIPSASCLSLSAQAFTLNSANLDSFLLSMLKAISDLVPSDGISGGDGNDSGGSPGTSRVSASGITYCLKN